LIDDELTVVQGPVQTVGTKLCCESRSNCQIQVQYQLGNTYTDVTNQRTRFDDRISGETIVSFYGIQKTMLVVNQTCKEYCPMQGETLTPGMLWCSIACLLSAVASPHLMCCIGFLDVNATDKGASTLPDGRKANHWQWKDTIMGIIVMEVIDVYVNQT
jgi:hypothetical protein